MTRVSVGIMSYNIPYKTDPDTGECPSERIAIVIYDTREAMIEAATQFNGGNSKDAWGITQGVMGAPPGDMPRAIIRLCQPALTHSILLHEIIHATQFAFSWSGMLAALETNPWDLNNEDYAFFVQTTYEAALESIDWSLSTNPLGVDRPADESMEHADGVPNDDH